MTVKAADIRAAMIEADARVGGFELDTVFDSLGNHWPDFRCIQCGELLDPDADEYPQTLVDFIKAASVHRETCRLERPE